MQRILLATAVLLAALRADACTAPAAQSSRRPLHGPWRWISSTGGITGIRMDPASEGFSAIFYFQRDGTVDIYRDDRRQDRLILDAVPETTANAPPSLRLHYAHPLSIFPFDPGIDHQTARLAATDTLLLIDPCCDRYTHTLARIE